MKRAVLVPVETPEHRAAAQELVAEYLHWVAKLAQSEYGLAFDVDAMIRSDMEDPLKFFPPSGRFYLVRVEGDFVGIGCLKRLGPAMGEVQRMYVRPQVRGAGAGRLLVERLVEDARSLGYLTLRLESLRALTAAHQLYRSIGFVEIEPYAQNSMDDYQEIAARDAYRRSAIFMEATLAAE